MRYWQPYDQPSNPDASYQNGDPTLGIPGSIADGRAWEHPQREIIAAIVAAGLTPSADDLTQLLQAIRTLGRATNYQTYNPGSYTFIVPAGVRQLYVRLWSGGGGGGHADVNGAGGGGGGGGYSEGWFAVTPGDAIGVHVGLGGIGSTSGVNGTNGDNSTFGTILTCTGGRGGHWAASAQIGDGGLGGTGAGGLFNGDGGFGHCGIYVGTGNAYGGGGGHGGFGGSGAGMTTATPNGGTAPGGGGGGGGGTGGANNGGTGGGGYCVIQW